MMRAAFLFAAAVSWTAFPAGAADLGALGPTYPVAEPSLLDVIGQRLGALERSGELARWQREAAQRGKDAVLHPAPLAGLTTGARTRTTYFDPTYTLDRNVMDQQGRLMYAAGFRKNPLEVVSMTRQLLFFDSRDQRQVDMAAALIARIGAARVKPILVGGSYLDLMKRWKTQVYYDQQATLVRKFRITQVPALVYQEGMRLRIDELGLAQ